MSLEGLREELKSSIDEKINAAIVEADANRLKIENVRNNLATAIADKKTKRSTVSRETGLGYITIVNVLNPNYPFEVKYNTLKKIEDYLNALA